MAKAQSLLLMLALCLAACPALAHDPGLSTASLELGSSALHATLAFSHKDAEALLAPASEPAPADLPALVAQEFQVLLDGRRLSPSAATGHTDAQGNVVVELTFPTQPATRLAICSHLLQRLPVGHRQCLEFRTDASTSIERRLLSQSVDSASFGLQSIPGPTPAAPTAWEFLKMGINHILTGYDHLLFLFGLLLVTPRVGSALKVISCFTVAHSLTLALATLNPVPARYVEPLIAASIVYIGLENLWKRGAPAHRWLLTFGFGLVHGCGFASALRELGVGAHGGGILLPLLSFNLGVEAGQLFIAAIVLPILWRLRAKPAFIRFYVPACSALIVLLGSVWLVQRLGQT